MVNTYLQKEGNWSPEEGGWVSVWDWTLKRRKISFFEWTGYSGKTRHTPDTRSDRDSIAWQVPYIVTFTLTEVAQITLIIDFLKNIQAYISLKSACRGTVKIVCIEIHVVWSLSPLTLPFFIVAL